jgi:integrase
MQGFRAIFAGAPLLDAEPAYPANYSEGVPPRFRRIISEPAMPKLTKALIAAIEPTGNEQFVWDTEVRRFGVRVHKSGRMAYVIQYKTPQGATRRLDIGPTDAITLDEARKLARARQAEIAQGRDPSAERKEARKAEKPMTVAELCGLYMEAARAGRVLTRFGRPKSASTVAIDEGRIARHIVPLIGLKPATELTRQNVQRMVDDIAAGKTAGTFKTKARGKAVVEGGAGTAARVTELLGGVWSWAEKRGHVSGQNPVRSLEKHRGEAKDRTLSREELNRLGAALDAHAERFPAAVNAIRLIAMTGMRREEAVGLRWREIDFEGSCVRLESSKTGRSTRPIGKPVIDLLRSLPRMSDEYVFPSRDNSQPAALKKVIGNIFDAARLPDARSHDLRRTFASMAAEMEYGDATIGELLGHAKRGVTERHYIRRPDAVLIAAASAIASGIDRAFRGEEAEVIAIKQRRSQ